MKASKVTITSFFTGMQVLVFDTRSNDSRFSQQYFIERGLPLLSAQKSGNPVRSRRSI
jgi:hypothetical protein